METLSGRAEVGDVCADLQPSMTVASFQKLLAETTGIEPGAQEVLVGFPPKPVKVTTPGSVSLSHDWL